MPALLPDICYHRRFQGSSDIVASLKACINHKDLTKGTTLHAYVHETGLLEKDEYIASTLVNMYAKCGALSRAAGLLDELPVRDAVCWNALITGYVQNNRGEEALQCLKRMEEEKASPNSVTYTCALKACANIGAAEKGQQIHDEILRQGLLAKDPVLGGSLVEMYVKCGALRKAAQVLDQLQVRNAVSWTTLMAGYVQEGNGKAALECFDRMQNEGHLPSAVTFAFIFKACSITGAAHTGEQFHHEIVRQGLLENDPVLGSSVVDMYAKCGALSKAAQVLEGLCVRDIVAWSTLIAGYSEYNCSEEAIKCFEHMQVEGISPNMVTYVYVLKACGNIRAVGKGKEIHKEIVRKGFLGGNFVLDTNLVDMYARCGEFGSAVQALDEISVRDAVSWNALIAGYLHHGLGMEALKCFEQMEREGLPPNVLTFACILKACGITGAFDKGEQIYVQIVRNNLLKNDVIGAAMVDMYIHCGELAKAAIMVHEFSIHDVSSWNALITGYVQQGESETALKCFRWMQQRAIYPNEGTFSSILKACISIGATGEAQQIHWRIVRAGLLGKDIVLGTILVDMHAKFGAVRRAIEMLDAFAVRDVVSWSALITGFILQGHDEKALWCFKQMQLEGLFPDPVAFISVLKACGSIGAADELELICAEIVRWGLHEHNIELGTVLVDAYCKCGALAKAAQIFDELPVRDTVSWSAIIAGYVQQGLDDEAYKCFSNMESEGLCPDVISLIGIFKACGSIEGAEKGKSILNEILQQGSLAEGLELGNALLNMYVNHGTLASAAQLLCELPIRDVVSWSVLITGYAQKGEGLEALKCFKGMQCENIFPDTAAFISVLKACGTTGDVNEGEQIHEEILRQGLLGEDIVLGNALVDMYVKCGALGKASGVFDKLPVRNVITWNTLMAGYAWQGQGKQVFGWFEVMQREGFSPNTVTFACILKACASIGALSKGEQIHRDIAREGLLTKDNVLVNRLVEMYANCGDLVKASQVLDDIPYRHVVSWNMLIAGYAQHGRGEEALECFIYMQQEGLFPSAATLCCVLSACSHSGLVPDGQVFSANTTILYGITTDSVHHTCVIDLYGRAGELDKAQSLTKVMQPDDQLAVWLSLLGACHKYGNVMLGRIAFNNAIQIDKNDATAYILMIEIYAAANMHENARDIEAKRLLVRSHQSARRLMSNENLCSVHTASFNIQNRH